MDRQEIQRWIPHRTPFLFVDRVLELAAERIVTEWDLDPEASFFQGHYPGSPIVPGVLLNEHVFQSAALLMAKLNGDEPSVELDALPVLTRIQDARFKSIVRPGETIQAVTTLKERLGPACYMHSTIRCEDRKIARLDFVVAMTSSTTSQ